MPAAINAEGFTKPNRGRETLGVALVRSVEANCVILTRAGMVLAHQSRTESGAGRGLAEDEGPQTREGRAAACTRESVQMNEPVNTRPIVLFDFDGTITRRDSVDAILEAYADTEWETVEEEWKSGRIGSRECLRAQMALVRATPRELDTVLDTIDVDEGLGAVVDVCATHDVAAYIVSDGFDYCIRRILSRPSLASHDRIRNFQVFCSHLEFREGCWDIEFPYFPQVCEHGCATCKPAVMRWLNHRGARTIFVGDGLSDRYAATSADFVFGKNLAAYCREHAIQHSSYRKLDEVAPQLDGLLRTAFRNFGSVG